MPTYPLPVLTKYSYRENPRAFGSPRNSNPPGRVHGAIDLYAPDGTEVCACETGVVLFPGPYDFYRALPTEPYVKAVEIKLDDGRIQRYCEMLFLPKIKPGYRVAEGEILGHLKAMGGLPAPGNCMLHFEMYSGTAHGPLTTNVMPTRRRSDLMDPTAYMDACTVKP